MLEVLQDNNNVGNTGQNGKLSIYVGAINCYRKLNLRCWQGTNSLDYASSTPVKNFFNLAFENGLFPVINRPTRVTWANATAIDHMLTNTIMDQDLQNGIIKLDISDHFPIFTILNSKMHKNSVQKQKYQHEP